MSSLLPLRVNEAMPLVPLATRFALPSVVPARLNVAVPAGAFVPLAAFTVAVSTVLAVVAIEAGFAVSVVVVVKAEPVTVTTVVPVDPFKVELPL